MRSRRVDSPPQRPVWVAIWGEVQRRLFLIGYAVAEEQVAVPERRVGRGGLTGGGPHRRGRGRLLGVDQRRSNLVVQLQGLHSGWGSSPYRFKYGGL
ncbi:MAG: hypothetical protein ACO2PN_03970 [Pyrobaculum sp.]